MDEVLCSKSKYPLSLGSSEKVGLQSCPSFGHVLYLFVSNSHDYCDEAMKGITADGTMRMEVAPTIVFEEEGEGGGAPRKMGVLWSVPAVIFDFVEMRCTLLAILLLPFFATPNQ